MADMSFEKLVERLHYERMKDLARKETMFPFYWNSRGIRETSFEVGATAIRKDGMPIDLGKVKLYYADQNPGGKSKEAWMVRTGKLKRSQVGWLWTYIGTARTWLAKITPRGASRIASGFISDGRLIIRR